MKTHRLILMRHGTAAPSSETGDHGRALTSSGVAEAGRVASQLRRREWWPEWVASSDARRTRETCRGLALDLEGVLFKQELYLAGRAVFTQLLEASIPIGTALLVGHNPGISSAASWLSGVRLQMSPANAALLEADAASWEVALGMSEGWRLVSFLRP